MALDDARRDIREATLVKDISAAEHDPYSAAVELIVVALEWGLDDGISGGMNQREFDTLDALAKTLATLDPASAPEPRAG